MNNVTPIPISQSNFGLSTSFYAVLSKLKITDKIWVIDRYYNQLTVDDSGKLKVSI